MKHLLINNSSSVSYDESNTDDIKVYIDGKLYDFKESKDNRVDYAIATKRHKYAQTLNNQFENLLLLTGAGSSIGWGKDGKTGKSMVNLWDGAEALLTSDAFGKLLSKIGYEEKIYKLHHLRNNRRIRSFNTLYVTET